MKKREEKRKKREREREKEFRLIISSGGWKLELKRVRYNFLLFIHLK